MSRYRYQRTNLLIAVLITLGVAAAGLQLNLFRDASVSAQEAKTGILYLPELDRGEGWRTTINLTNLESKTINVFIIAYDQAGRALGEVDALTTLEGSRTTALDAQALPPGVAALTIKAGGRIAGNAAFRYDDGSKSEVIPALNRSSHQLDFPLLLNRNLTEQTVTLLNPNQDAAAATLLAFSRDGRELERQSLPLIAPSESRSLKLAEVFGKGAQSFGSLRSVATVRIVSDQALVGWQTAAQTRGDLAGLPALVEKSLGWSFYPPASGQVQKLQSTIRLYNPGEAPANVSVEVFESSQSSIGVIEQFQLAPGAIHFFSAPNAASLRVVSDQPISGYQLFGVANGRGLAAAPGIADEDQINVGYALTGSADGAVLMAYPLMRLEDGSLAAGFAGTPEDNWSMALSKFNEQAKAAIEGRTEAGAAAAVSSYSASGKVTGDASQPVSGVLMTFTRVSGAGPVPPPVFTDLNGSWSTNTFAGNTIYRVTPSRKGYVFSPASRDFSSAGSALNFQSATTISGAGNVYDSAGRFGIAGVTITFTNTSTGQSHSTVTTNVDGVYSQDEFKAGVTYRATPSKAGLTFTPASLDFNTNNSQLFFAAISSTGFKTSGKVVGDGGLPLSGVLMTFTRVSGAGPIPPPVFTDLNGAWLANGFAGNTIYRVTPSRKGYAFYSSSRDFSMASSALNFSGAGAIFGAGVAYDSAGGFGIAGVTITFTNTSTGQSHSTVTTNVDGIYRQDGLKAGVTYRAIPSKAGLTFTPTSLDFNADHPHLFFAAISSTGFKASGKVVGDGGLPLSGVLMTFTRVSGAGAVPPSVFTDLNGAWLANGFAGNTIYRVTPSRKGYAFYSSSLDFSSASSALNFSGATTISGSGVVYDSAGNFGIAGVTITFTNASTGQLHSTVTTDADGRYNVSGLKAGVTYRATPSKAGLSFTPASRDFNANTEELAFAAAAN
ncbi:MAG TPA: carboxypeptidase regulatory-like domain-containing protein [Blastocatellia bacterium]|nr:carboxypeptidase regulatory-like domain-containing protein [Blastocatellia bacterium]